MNSRPSSHFGHWPGLQWRSVPHIVSSDECHRPSCHGERSGHSIGPRRGTHPTDPEQAQPDIRQAVPDTHYSLIVTNGSSGTPPFRERRPGCRRRFLRDPVEPMPGPILLRTRAFRPAKHGVACTQSSLQKISYWPRALAMLRPSMQRPALEPIRCRPSRREATP